VARWADGRVSTIELALPGSFNQANALMAAVAAEVMGVDVGRALSAMASVPEVAGRFTRQQIAGVATRLLLAKNPAGWDELLALVAESSGPVVVAINARIADGRDPSWLWDVPFEVLAGRVVVAAGERCHDLSVRLHYAGVAHVTVANLEDAVSAAQAATGGPDGVVEFIGNYTAFHDLWAAR
jgi:UDP-N-acetylmuramyl tripeptide synthase